MGCFGFNVVDCLDVLCLYLCLMVLFAGGFGHLRLRAVIWVAGLEFGV